MPHPQPPALQLIYDTAPIGLAFLSPDCRYLQINQRLTEICGISVEDHLGRTVRECVPGLAASVEAIVRSIMDTGQPVTGIEVAGQRGNQNDERSWVTYWHPLYGSEGTIIGVNVAAEEVTERKRAEAALQASERQFHTLADSIPQLVWMAGPAGKIFWFNNHWNEYTGTSAAETNSHDWQTILEPASLEEARLRWAKSLEAGSPLEMELLLRRKDRTFHPFLTRAVPLRDSNDTLYGWIGTHIDISERKRSEQLIQTAKETSEATLRNLRETQISLIESEKLAALGRLVAGVAHEINNPVGTCLTVASSLQSKTGAFARELEAGNVKRSSLNEFLEASREASSQLIASLSRAAELVQSFKQVATDQSQSSQSVFDLGDLTRQIAMSLRSGLRKRHVTLNVECDCNLEMNSYPGPYGQVLTNLFLNSAVHAFADDGKTGIVNIEVQAFGSDSVAVLFSDNGCGMCPTVKRKAFDPFFTTRRDRGSIGLGLHIVHSIVSNCLGGRVNLDSEEGQGTRVRMIFPRTAPGLFPTAA